MSADDFYRLLFFLAWPAAVLYPLVYGIFAPWWKTATGRALMAKATGVGLMVTMVCLFFVFGPDYPARDTVRIGGMALVCIGTWGAFMAMLARLLRPKPPTAR